ACLTGVSQAGGGGRAKSRPPGFEVAKYAMLKRCGSTRLTCPALFGGKTRASKGLPTRGMRVNRLINFPWLQLSKTVINYILLIHPKKKILNPVFFCNFQQL
ncbi:MAG: hypothetical protein V1775_06825, partial [Bacteroidota bacterium]